MSKPMKEKLMLIPERGHFKMLDFQPGDNNLDFFYEHIKCDLIDIVRPYALQKESGKCKNLILIVDDESLLKANPKVNIFASLAYGYPIYGKVLVGKEQARDDGIHTVGLNEEDTKAFNEAMLEMIDNIKNIKIQY
jgi:hypothetical protein